MISIYKVNALFVKQMKNLAYNSFILVGLVVPLIFAVLFGRLIPGTEAIALPMSVLMNIALSGMNTMCILVAEEKEKDTLRVLMTSTVSPLDFLISNTLATLVITVILNSLMYVICGTAAIVFWQFFLLTTLGSIAALLLGGIVGIVSKNQMSASGIMTPFAMVLLLIPMFGEMLPGLAAVGEALFSQQVYLGLFEMAEGTFYWSRMAVILVNIVVIMAAFVLVYKKVGLDED